MSKPYLFSPSEFAFGYSGCKRCYFDLKVNNIRINFGFPSIFSKIDSIQKEFYHNKTSKYLNTNKISLWDFSNPSKVINETSWEPKQNKILNYWYFFPFCSNRR